MDMDLIFFKPYKGKSKASNLFKAISDSQTVLTSEFYADESYPMNLPSYIFGRPMIKEVTEKNLKNIKAILEK
jgi:hypothetical protein